MLKWSHQLDGGASLALRDPWQTEEYHALGDRNLDRLQQWEAWAHLDRSVEATRGFLVDGLRSYAEGTQVPTVVVADGKIVGSVGLYLDQDAKIASLGYWVDQDAEGRGLAFAAASCLVDLAFDDLGMRRLEIRTAAHNLRALRLAERLGLSAEGVLRSALVLPRGTYDVAIWARVL